MFQIHAVRGDGVCILRRAFSRTDLGKTEVENLGLSTVCYKDVGWLDVTVDLPFECAAFSP